MTVIELGLVTGDDNPSPEPDRRPLPRRDLKRMLVAAVAALCVLTVTGSAPPVSHAPRQLWSVPFREGNGIFIVSGGAVYVLLSVSGASTLSAYSLRTGQELWTSSELADAAWVSSVQAGVMLLPAADTTVEFQDGQGGQVSRQFTRETAAVDAATGRQLWRRPGEFSALTGGHVLMVEWNDDGSAARNLTVVNLHDGVPVWSRPAGALETWTSRVATTGDTDRLVTVAPGGKVAVYDLADGRPVTTGRVPWQGQNPQEDSYANISVEGHAFYLENVERGRGTVTAYDTETLHEKWRIGARSYGGFYSCGAVLCVNGDQGATGYDRETGQVRWRTPGYTNAIPLRDGRIVISDDEDDARHSLIDGNTGRRIADLGRATLVWDASSPQETPYLVTSSTRLAEPTTVAVLDQRTGEVWMRGGIDPVLDYSCQSSDDMLVCVTPEGRLTVTDVG
ncbi:PQQ-binding-like beta-propeller repeat protein [Actinoplanes sp. NPDC049548]|uniref:outer membrane protein assembly factor BamB family protein n=1 Tax=Actinoplanes sp. NPDC049548 TaxID=3155152 RepID=UPI003421825B